MWALSRKEARYPHSLKYQHLEDSGIPGTNMLIATMPCFVYPLGIIWYSVRAKRQRAEIKIVHTYVHEQLRRCRIRSRLHGYLLTLYHPYCVTTQLAKGPAEKCLLSMGFKYKNGEWVYRMKEKDKTFDPERWCK